DWHAQDPDVLVTDLGRDGGQLSRRSAPHLAPGLSDGRTDDTCGRNRRLYVAFAGRNDRHPGSLRCRAVSRSNRAAPSDPYLFAAYSDLHAALLRVLAEKRLQLARGVHLCGCADVSRQAATMHPGLRAGDDAVLRPDRGAD